MSWFAELAGKAENLLTNEQTGAALRNQNVMWSRKYERPTNTTHPEPVWNSKKRPSATPRPLRRNNMESKPSHILPPNKKGSPVSHLSMINTQEHMKSPTKGKKPSIKNINNLQIVRPTVGDFTDANGLKGRRYPSDQDIMYSEDIKYRFENLEVEYAMMKNEINVLNKEMAALLDKLRVTETELDEKSTKLKNTEIQCANLSSEKEEMKCKLSEVQSKVKSITELEEKIKELCDKNAELENMVVQVNEKHNETISAMKKIEAELRHANKTIKELEANLDKSNDKHKNLESDWASYQYRVKNMLSAKDKEILALQQCRFTEDKTSLLEQVQQLKDERDVLSSAVNRLRAEYESVKRYLDTLEMNNASAERVMLALRNALRDERAARNRAEAQCGALSKELKAIQIETGQTIANLRTALRDKHQELDIAKDTVSSVRTSDTSALNVADYDVSEMNFDNEQVYQLTQKLVSKQGKFESLLAEYNTLKIQLEKLQSINKSERLTNTESEVQFKEYQHALNKSRIALLLSRKIGHISRTHPQLCVLILVYMVILHLWVFTVI